LQNLEVFERGLDKTWVRAPFVKSFLQVLVLNKSIFNGDIATFFGSLKPARVAHSFFQKRFQEKATQFSNWTLV